MCGNVYIVMLLKSTEKNASLMNVRKECSSFIPIFIEKLIVDCIPFKRSSSLMNFLREKYIADEFSLYTNSSLTII